MISLCTFVKNEQTCIEHMFRSVEDYVDEIVVVDTGSTDNTIEICKERGCRVYEVGFTDFAKIRTLTAHLAKEAWVLMLDADETLTNANLLPELVKTEECAYAFPRRRWLDLDQTYQIEMDAYPDWQVRLFRNNPSYHFKRALHEYFNGCAVKNLLEDCPIIEHYHDYYKTPKKLAERNALYSRLAKVANVPVDHVTPKNTKC